MPRKVTRKKRFLVAGEGQGEQSLVAWLQQLCHQFQKGIHLQFVGSDGGDSLEVVTAAVRRMRKETHTRKRYKTCIVLLDLDRVDIGRQHGRDAPMQARKRDLQVVLVRSNLEGLLTRLHKGQEIREVPASIALRELRKLWPEYEKPATAAKLANRFDMGDLRRAAKHDRELKKLLGLIELG